MKRLLALICIMALILPGCAKPNNVDDEGDARQTMPAVTNMAGNTTSAEVCNDLVAAGLSNVTLFNEWVLDFAGTAGEDAGLTDRWVSPGAFTPDLAKCMDGWERRYDYSDADCRMTAMLLLDGILTAERTDSDYNGTYLMFDVDAIENVPKYEVIKKNYDLFTTVFGERTPEEGEDPSEVFGRIWNEYGIKVGSDNVSLLSLVFYDPDSNQVFVGHTGVLIKQTEEVYLYVEKLAFEQPYQAILTVGIDQLTELLSTRSEYSGGEDEPGPYIYVNDQYLGELAN
ncbi:MAG: DUF4300 family protein [Mogibacterium sp.]|nr:DUF4300 family protein [Mogibacterium sp.]